MYAQAQPYEREQAQHERLHRVLRFVGPLGALLALCGGIGWLYLLRHTTTLDAGPKLRGALPLEELAGEGAQPLLRMAVAWLPAGFVAGLALSLTVKRRWLIVLTTSLLAFVLIFSTTAGSEAASHNLRFVAHLVPTLQHPGVWVAVGLIAIGALLAALVTRRGSSGQGSDGSAAA